MLVKIKWDDEVEAENEHDYPDYFHPQLLGL